MTDHQNSSAATEYADREELALARLRAAVTGEEFEWELYTGDPFDDVQFLLAAYDRLTGAPAQSVGMREALEQIEAIADRPISGTSLQMKANRFDAIKAKARAALAHPSPAATVETEVRGQAHRDAISPSGGKMFNAHNGCSAGNEQVAREASDLADKIEHALRTEGKVTLHQTDGTRALYAVRKLFADEPQTAAWQPIETAPKDGPNILVCRAHEARSVCEAFWWEGAWRCWDGENHTRSSFILDYLTHWQPMPAPASYALSRPQLGGNK